MAREYERFPRPPGPYYETRFNYLSQGDLFAALPFPIEGADFVRHDALPGLVLQPLGIQRAMVVSPTCDFRRPSAAALDADSTLEPYTLQAHVTIAPVLSLAAVAEKWGERRAASTHLARRYDALRRYMYLPATPGEPSESEWLVDLSQVHSISLRVVLAALDGRLAQLTLPAAQQLQYKIVMAASAMVTDRNLYRPAMD